MSQNRIVTVPTFGNGASSPGVSNVAGSDEGVGLDEGVDLEVENG
jgi:hypothetical protein